MPTGKYVHRTPTSRSTDRVLGSRVRFVDQRRGGRDRLHVVLRELLPRVRPGPEGRPVEVTFFQDYAAASVHAILQPLYSVGGTFALEVRPENTTVQATNPKATMLARMLLYAGFGGAVGEACTCRRDVPERRDRRPRMGHL